MKERIHIMKREAVATLLAFLFIGLAVVASKMEYDTFNHGYCYKCGTKYNAVSRKASQTYYECPNCYYGTYF